MAQAVAELHSYGLASNDILKLKHAFDLDIPARGFWRKLLTALIGWKYRKRAARRKRQGE